MPSMMKKMIVPLCVAAVCRSFVDDNVVPGAVSVAAAGGGCNMVVAVAAVVGAPHVGVDLPVVDVVAGSEHANDHTHTPADFDNAVDNFVVAAVVAVVVVVAAAADRTCVAVAVVDVDVDVDVVDAEGSRRRHCRERNCCWIRTRTQMRTPSKRRTVDVSFHCYDCGGDCRYYRLRHRKRCFP